MSEISVKKHSEGHARVTRIAVYSDRPELREDIRQAIGTDQGPGRAPVEFVDFAVGPALMEELFTGGIDLCILDAETAPLGGMGLSYQIKHEVTDGPPVLLLLARRDDAWLATWSQADAVYPLPIDPLEFPTVVRGLL